MSERKGGIPEKETICWDCQNYSRCSWARGIPVKGWKATPTTIKDVWEGEQRIINSFLVEDCPQFKADKKRRVLLKDVAVMLGMDERALYRFIHRKGRDALGELIKEKGYRLRVYKEEQLYKYYLEKL